MAFETFPVLQTERLLLRRITQEDVHAVFQFRSDVEAQRYNEGAITRLEQASELIARLEEGYQNRTMVEWGVTLKGGDETVIGLMGYANWSQQNRRAEIGYDLRRDYWGQGIASEALTTILAFGFGVMDLNRIHACTWVENVASVRLLERLGLRLEGVLRDEYWEADAFHDEAHYALLRREYEAE